MSLFSTCCRTVDVAIAPVLDGVEAGAGLHNRRYL